MTNFKKIPWYVWLSIPALGVLWFNTAIRILFWCKNPFKLINDTAQFNLWLTALGHMLGLILGFIFFPFLLVCGIFELLTLYIPSISEIPPYIGLIILYFLGVYATYRHVLWRRKHLFQENKE